MMSKINFGIINLGGFEVDNNYQDTETYISVKWVDGESHRYQSKKVTWGDILNYQRW